MSYGTTTRSANIRRGPSTDFEISTTASGSTPLTVFGRNEPGDWLQVRAPDRTGGWISAGLVALAVPVASIPLVETPEPPVQPTALPTNTPAIIPADTPAVTRADTGPAVPTNTPVVAAAPGILRLNVLNFDGAVRDVESDEWIEIINAGGSALDISGWRLQDDDGNVFVFRGFVMQPGQACRVYTNEIHPETCGFSFGHGQAIWGNKGDRVQLLDPGGNLVDERCWGSGC